jgi:hypothetical protein
MKSIDVRYREAERRRWRKLPADQLENLILAIRRNAGAGHHLGPRDWAEVDCMRRWLEKRQRETA